MNKLIFLTFLFISNLFAEYKVFENKKIFTIEIKNTEYKEVLINLKNELLHESYTIVHELDLAKSTNKVAEILKKKKVLKNGRNILVCKTSFTLEMVQENIHNITYCPLAISIYEKDETIYISYRKYFALKKEDIIAKKINANLKNLIKASLE